MFFQNINYWTVIVATVVGMAIGFGWYSPKAFGGIWMKSRPNAVPKPMKYSIPTTTVSAFICAFVLAVLFNSLVVTSISGMILLAVSVWLGFVVPVKLSDYLFGGEALYSVLISSGYELFTIAIMSLIIGIWR